MGGPAPGRNDGLGMDHSGQPIHATTQPIQSDIRPCCLTVPHSLKSYCHRPPYCHEDSPLGCLLCSVATAALPQYGARRATSQSCVCDYASQLRTVIPRSSASCAAACHELLCRIHSKACIECARDSNKRGHDNRLSSHSTYPPYRLSPLLSLATAASTRRSRTRSKWKVTL